MKSAVIEILEEVKNGNPGVSNLCFQKCIYKYSDGSEEYGFRFVWRKPNGSLLVSRGQARIPSTGVILELVGKAIDAGWGCENFWPKSGGFKKLTQEDIDKAFD